MDRRNFLNSIGLAALTGLTSLRGITAANPSGGRLVVDGSNSSLINREFLSQVRTGGVHCVHKSAHTFLELGDLWNFMDENPDDATIATTAAEISEARQQGKIAFVLGSQHGNELEKHMNKIPMMTRGSLRASLRAFYQLGIRFQGLCYNVTNIFGGGCLEPATPLTGEGAKLVEHIHELGMILDVGGHTGEQTSLDAIAISKGVPVVCTHTNAASLVPNARASSDRLLETIAGTGGVVGITAISDFQMRSRDNYLAHGPSSPQADLVVMLDQYDYMKKLIGVDHIGMGPDFFWPARYFHTSENSITFPGHVLSDGLLRTVKNFEDLSQLPNLTRGLSERGWSEIELDKVLGSNWLRVYGEIWGG